MRLLEFFSDPTLAPPAVLKALKSHLGGRITRIGGPSRVYYVGNTTNQTAAIYVFEGTVKAFGMAWIKSPGGPKVKSFYVWNKFNVNKTPDFELDIPEGVTFPEVVDQVAHWLKSPSIGKELTEDEMLDEARRSNDEEFMAMARRDMPEKVGELTLTDLMKIAKDNDVQIPSSIRNSVNLKVDAHHWNLSGKATGSGQDLSGAAAELGGELSDEPSVDPNDPIAASLKQIEKIGAVNKIAGTGRLYLMGRNAKNRWFRIAGVDDMLAELERMHSRHIESLGGGDDREGMEEQYDMLKEKVRLVAGGESAFIKSLLITGAPSSGKTFVVMQTIRELGLKAGRDYVVKKGHITTNSMYRTLIERVNGLVIFDDCDSVVEEKAAVNMLKGALDTDPIREISYDVRGGINTATMEDEDREVLVDAMSRVLRNVPEEGDIEMFDRYMKKKKKKTKSEDSEGFEDEDLDGDDDDDKIHEIQKYITMHLPNKIDFKGRIIFISNMDEADWDSAILTRAFTINMNFSSGEMLDYIDKIKSHIPAALTDEQKQEVLDWIRELYTMGKLKKSINFRLIQQAFDLRLTSNWKKLISML